VTSPVTPHPPAARAGTAGRRADRAVHALPPASTMALTHDYLVEVDEALSAAIASLVHTWRVELAAPLGAGSPPAPPADILLDHDLPEMLQALNGTGGKRIRPSMTYWGWVAASVCTEG
jgi:geranylgeranyl diphosphate synthase type I